MDYTDQSTQSSFEEIRPKPQNNLVLAIVGTVLGICSPCCIGLIVGIVAIVFATQVNSKFDAGDYIGAEKAAKNSKILSYVAIGLGIIGFILSLVTIITGGTEAYMEQYKSILENAQ